MLGFVDESGDTGFRFDRNSSPYFVVAMVLVPGAEEAEKLRLAIDELKEELRKPSMEFHFTNTDGTTRHKFFDTIRNHDFIVVAAVCDKGKLRTLKGNHAEFLLSTFGAAMEHARDRGLIDAANIKYDEAGGECFSTKAVLSTHGKSQWSRTRKIHQALRAPKLYREQSYSACGHGLRGNRQTIQQASKAERELPRNNKAPSRLGAAMALKGSPASIGLAERAFTPA